MVFLYGTNQKERITVEKEAMQISDDFGKMLKKLRKDRGYSLERLSELTGISASYLNRLEKSTRRSPGFIKIVNIAQALNVEPSMLVGSNLNLNEGEPVSVSELLFSNQIEHNGEILSADDKEVLLEILETILNAKWDKNSILTELQEIGELISEFKEL